jgi:hypothetical protein
MILNCLGSFTFKNINQPDILSKIKTNTLSAALKQVFVHGLVFQVRVAVNTISQSFLDVAPFCVDT